MMKKRMLAWVILLVPALALAGWFDGGNKGGSKPGAAPETRRYVLKIPNKAAEQDLIRLIGINQNILEETRVLSRLTEEKKSQLQQFLKGLLGAFSMKPATNYQFDPKTRTIYELIPSASAATSNQPPPGATTVPPAGFNRRLHLQLTTEQQVQQFLRLTTGRKLVQDEMQVFASVIREKQQELDGVVGLLNEKFSISRDKNYEYEPSTMRLYEVGVAAMPSKAKTSASGSSAIQLRATLPQQVAPK
jgi:hypothetical protein